MGNLLALRPERSAQARLPPTALRATRREAGAHWVLTAGPVMYLEAFGQGDAEGDNALTGTYNGKQAVAGLWGEFGSKDFRTEPHDTVESADIPTYSGTGRLVAFDTRADAKLADRVFAK